MISRGHKHLFRPFNVWPRPDGGRDVFSRCVCGGTPDRPTVLEQRITVGADGAAVAVAYRFGGVWFDARDLLRLGAIGVSECRQCGGDPWPVGGLVCPTCGGAGVTDEAGEPLRAPDLVQVS